MQVFVIPRLLSVETYGEYRLFLVYTGYMALFHLGLADGAFLRWVGAAPSEINREWKTVARWQFALHAAFLSLGVFIAFVSPWEGLRIFSIALVACALCSNASLLSQYALQAAGDFSRAGRVAILSNGLFIGLVIIASARTLTSVLSMYVTAFALAALYGAWGVFHLRSATSDSARAKIQFTDLIRRGSPVLGATVAAALAQSVDRILVSIFTPIASFALYGFASTASVAAASATQALSRVALSHAGRRERPERAQFLSGYYDVIAAGFGAALLGLPVFEALVSRHIPAYAAALPIVRALTLGLPFWVATHVVIVGTLQSYGLVRQQFSVELGGVLLVAISCLSALLTHQTLWAVASASSAAAVVTVLAGAVVVLRSDAPAGIGPTLRFVVVSMLQGAALLVAIYLSGHWLQQTVTYLALAALPTLLAAKRARNHGW